jgi:hypothetical protein
MRLAFSPGRWRPAATGLDGNFRDRVIVWSLSVPIGWRQSLADDTATACNQLGDAVDRSPAVLLGAGANPEWLHR